MPLLPIDLQTMFSHMNQIGKDQAVQKGMAPQHQALQAQELAQKTREKDTSVNETDEVGDGLEKIGNKEQEKKGEEKESSQKDGKEKEAGEKKKPVVYQDPNLGHHIDIIG